jgi:hypothetical protein
VPRARCAVTLLVVSLLLAQTGCGSDATDRPSPYSPDQVRAAFELAGMEAVIAEHEPAPLFAEHGASVVNAAIRDPSGTVIYRYAVVAGVFPTAADAAEALAQATREEPSYLVRRFANVIVGVTGFTFRPTSLPHDLAAAMGRLQRAAEVD